MEADTTGSELEALRRMAAAYERLEMQCIRYGNALTLEQCQIPRNSVLNRLRPEDFAFLRPHLYLTKFRERAVLQEQRRPIESIAFVEAGVISLRRTSRDSSVELGLISNHGMLGCSRLLGAAASSHQCVAISSGLLLKICPDRLLSLLDERPRIREQLFSHVETFLAHCSQIALCGFHHQLTQRLAGWLCHASDAFGRAEIPVTQDHLSMMLGLRRASIADALSQFEDERLIVKARGSLRILNRTSLERKACSCYSTMANAYRAKPVALDPAAR